MADKDAKKAAAFVKMTANAVKGHAAKCAGLFLQLDATGTAKLKEALDGADDIFTQFCTQAGEAQSLVAVAYTPEVPAAEPSELEPEPQPTPCSVAVSTELNYSRAASYILLLKKVPTKGIESGVPLATQLHVQHIDGGSDEQGLLSPYDSMHNYLRSVFTPLVASYLAAETDEGAEPSQTQKDVDKRREDLERSLKNVRERYTFSAAHLAVHPAIAEFYEGNKAETSPDAGLSVLDPPPPDKGTVQELEGFVKGWTQEISRVTKEDRDASEGSALRDIEFFAEMVANLKKIDEQLESPQVQCMQKGLISSRFALRGLEATQKAKEEKLKVAENALSLLQGLPISELKSVASVEVFDDMIERVFSSKKAGMLGLIEAVGRSFVPIPLWTRLDDWLISLTRDFVLRLKEVIQGEEAMHMSKSDFEQLMNSAKHSLKEWDTHYGQFYTKMAEAWKREDVKPRAGFGVSKERVEYTTAAFRKRITDIVNFREEHVQLEKAIERVPSAQMPKADEIIATLKQEFAKMQDVDWLDGFGDVVEYEAIEAAADETNDDEWGKAMERYEKHVSTVEDALIDALKKMLEKCEGADAMFRVFKKVNALFVRPAIKESIVQYQEPLVKSVKVSIQELEGQFTGTYATSEACVMSRVRDMTDVSGSIVWARQMERQLDVYKRQVAEILGEGWQRDALGKDLIKTSEKFTDKLKKTRGDAVKDWLQEAGQDRGRSGQSLFHIRKASGTYSVLVNFDPEATDLLKDFRLLQGIGLVDESTHGRQLIQIKWIKARYPSYRALADTLRTYELAVQRVTPDIEILTASARKQAQECIKEGVLKHKWTKPVVAEQYAIELGNVVRQFEEVVDGLLDNYRELEAKMAELEKCPAVQKNFEGNLREIQSTLNDMDLDDNDNGNSWMESFRSKVDAVLLTRMRQMIAEWAKNMSRLAKGGEDDERVCGTRQLRSAHRIRIRRGAIVLDPPVATARHHWLSQLHACLQIVTHQKRLVASIYEHALGVSGVAVDSSMGYLLEKLSPDFMAAQQAIEREIVKAQAKADKWMRYKSLWAGNSQDVLTYMTETHKDDLGKWISMLTSIRNSKAELGDEDSAVKDCAITVDCSDVQERVMDKYEVWHKQLQGEYAERQQEKTENWFKSVRDAKEKLEGFSLDSGETMQAIDFLTAVVNYKSDMEEWESTLGHFRGGEKLLKKERFKFADDWVWADGIENEWEAFVQIFEKKEKEVSKEKPKLQTKIVAQDDEIEKKVKALQKDWKDANLIDQDQPEGGHKQMLAQIATIEATIEEIDGDYVKIGQAKTILGVETEGGTNKLDGIKSDCGDLAAVWKEIAKIWDQDGGLQDLYDSDWKSVDAKKVLKTLKDLRKQLSDMPTELRAFAAWEHTKENVVERCIGQNQLLVGLRSESLKDRHWRDIRNKLDLPSMDLLTLGTMYDKDMIRHKQFLEKMMTQAQGEMALEEFMKGTAAKWEAYELELILYQNKVRLIKGWDDLFTDLGENIAAITSMRLSPYFKPFAQDAQTWEDSLNDLQERMDIWVDVQRRWVYLETIFLGSQEIKYQLPKEHKRFMSIDHQFKGLHKEVASDPKVLEVLKIDGLLEQLTKLQADLKSIQKALGDYLEKQRQQFARFYFVGDEDLLELIGSSKVPSKVQKHFSKMFAGISALVINEDEAGENVTVSGMRSHANLEEVTFREPISVTENPKINVWLTMLEERMRNALAHAAEDALGGLREMASKAEAGEGFAGQKEDFLAWLEQYPSQCGLLMCQVQWTEATEVALKACEAADNDTAPLEDVEKGIEATLGMLAAQVLVETSLLQRKKAEAMITELVHQRTVTRDLLEVAKTTPLSPTVFNWLYYMRFYWDDSEEKVESRCKLKMSDATFNYGYEYQGVVERLVQTPLSDRAYLTLTQALHYRLGGSPYGPAGTGKTETVKALGCQLGRYVLVFCCDENFDMHAMGRIFIGLCQVGAWGCFDEFNRLEERMLSAVSQQIQVIQEGLMTNGDAIDLLGRNFVPHTDMGIFVTMNPGYAGRSELPDNLKQLLRACAMTAPDRELIAEVMLYAQGFNNAEKLSLKIVPLFNLCRDQLSAQPHYDWGLRACKSVLNSAGNIKRAMLADAGDDVDTQGLVPEQELIIRSISETVAPKLVGGDLPLLKTLLTDVFPGIKQEAREFSGLMAAVEKEVERRGLEMGEVWVSKIVQLYQIQELHHGFMVVGPTGTGKTTAWEILLHAMGPPEKGGGIPGGREGKGWVIDPKSMPKEDLYGYMDNTTREWTDGVFTTIVRKIIDETKTLPEDQIMTHWIIFDGDVDPVWVENLNSVLDDNKLLTLPNGERLALLPNMRIVFEVQDLNFATPATVSRCGMVWFSDNTVKLQDTMKHYLSELRKELVHVDLPEGGEKMGDTRKQMEVQAKCAKEIESQIIGDGSLLEMALEEATKKFTVMDFVPLQSMNSYFALMNAGIQRVIDYNVQHEDFPLADDILGKYVRRHSLRSIAWACGGAMNLDDRLQFGRDIIQFSSEDVPDELGFGGAPQLPCYWLAACLVVACASHITLPSLGPSWRA